MAILAFAAISAIVVATAWVAQLGNSIHFGDQGEVRLIQAQLTRVSGQPYNVLFAGVDATSEGTPVRTEVLVLAHVDPQQQRVWLLWIPPNLLQAIPGRGDSGIADARITGGAAGTIRAAKALTGLKIAEYAEIGLPAIQSAVDAAGGVWVDVPAPMETTKVDDGSDNDADRIPAGSQLLDGSHALILARATPSSTDQGYQRVRDQQLLVDARAGALASKTSLPQSLSVLSAVAPSVKTTMSLGAMAGLRDTLRGAGSSRINEAVVVGAWKPPYIAPDSQSLARLVADMRNGRPFDVAAAQPERAAAASNAVASSSRPPAQVTVTVNNGGGISGAAKQAAGVLQTHGFQIASTGNANLNVYNKTLVIYKSDSSLARMVAQYLQPGARIVPSRGLYAFKTDILVVVGRDWDVGKVPAAQIQVQ